MLAVNAMCQKTLMINTTVANYRQQYQVGLTIDIFARKLPKAARTEVADGIHPCPEALPFLNFFLIY